jgi:iron complex outermembrane receptor protein
MDSYILGNVRLSWTSADERWQTSAFVENVGDERYVNIGFELPTLCGCNEESYGTPRWWGIQARYSWH